MRTRLWILVGLTAAFGAAGCATHTKGTWACPADRGVTCQNIDSLDHAGGARPGAGTPTAVEGSAAVRWWSANDALTGNFDRAPRREPDQVMKVVIAGWSDAAGDYHAPSEVFAVMRRGGWWAPPPATPLAPPDVEHAGKVAKPAAKAAAFSVTPREVQAGPASPGASPTTSARKD